MKTAYQQRFEQQAMASLGHDAIQARRTATASDALLRAQLRSGQHFLSPTGVAAAWDRLNFATIKGKRA